MFASKILLCIYILLLNLFAESSKLRGSECNLKVNGKGICTDYKNCKKLIDKLKNREIEFKDVNFCDSYGVVCCPSSVSSYIDYSSFNAQQEMNNKPRISEEKCKEYAKSTKDVIYIASPHLDAKPLQSVIDKCKHKSVSLIIGGTEARPNEFPHHAVLGRGKEDSIIWSCGGSLISPQFILTAAHCAPVIKFVMIGVTSLQESTDQIIYRVNEKFIHPNYNSELTNNDIALLKLNMNVRFNENIHPICLPTRQYNDPKAIVTGFGRTSLYDPISQKLLKVTLERFNNSECQEKYSDRTIDERTMLCYGHNEEMKDSCEGDSGGPLQISNENQVNCTYMQIGIVSFGPSLCGTVGIPGVYVNVFNYIDWIEGIVWKDEI